MDLFKRLRRKAFIPPLGTGLSSGGRIRRFDDTDQQLAANVGWVYTVNDAIADAVASIEIQLVTKKDNSPVESHSALDVWNYPNAVHTRTQLTKLYVTYMNLTGESYILKSDDLVKGYPAALTILPTQGVSFTIGENIADSTIKYNNTDYTYDQIIRDIIPDPFSPYHGRGVVEAAAASIDTDMSAIEFNRQFFANQARPSAVINVKNKMDELGRKRFKQEVNDLHTGTQNAGKPIILEGDLSVTPYGLSQKEMDYLSSRKFTKDEILAMFKTSPSMIGMSENVNKSNSETASKDFNRMVVVPKVRQLVDTLNRRLLTERDQDKLMFTYVDPRPEDQDQKLTQIDKGFGRWVTRNEAREAYGLEPIKGGDDFAPPPQPKPEPKKTAEPTELKKKLYSSSAERDAIGEAVVGIVNKDLNVFESEFGLVTRDYFDAVNAQIQKKLKGTSKHFKKKGVDTYMPDWAELEKQLVINIEPVYITAVGKSGQTAMVFITATSAYDINDPDPQKFIEKTPKKVMSDVADETEKQVRAELAQGLRAKETTSELSARINEVLGLRSQMRSQRIARTESVRASTFGQIDAWRQSGVVKGKEVYTAQDDRVCPICGPLDGTKLPLKDDFYKDGEPIPAGENKDGSQRSIAAYGDIQGPGFHPNCRCTLLAIVEGV